MRWIINLSLGNQVTNRRGKFRCLGLAHCHHAPGAIRAVQCGDQRGDGFQLFFRARDTQLAQRVDPLNLRLGVLRAVLGSQNLLRHLLQCRCYLGRLRVLQFKHASGTLDHRRLLGQFQRLFKASDRCLGSGNGQCPAIACNPNIKLAFRTPWIALRSKNALGGGDGVGGLGCLNLQHLRATFNATGLIKNVNDATHLVALAGECTHNDAAAIRTSGDRYHFALRGGLQITDLRNDAGGVGVTKWNERDGLRINVINARAAWDAAITIERFDQCGTFSNALRRTNNRQLADLVHR